MSTACKYEARLDPNSLNIGVIPSDSSTCELCLTNQVRKALPRPKHSSWTSEPTKRSISGSRNAHSAERLFEFFFKELQLGSHVIIFALGPRKIYCRSASLLGMLLHMAGSLLKTSTFLRKSPRKAMALECWRCPKALQSLQAYSATNVSFHLVRSIQKTRCPVDCRLG